MRLIKSLIFFLFISPLYAYTIPVSQKYVHGWRIIDSNTSINIQTPVITNYGPGLLSVYCPYNTLERPSWRVYLTIRVRSLKDYRNHFRSYDLTNIDFLDKLLELETKNAGLYEHEFSYNQMKFELLDIPIGLSSAVKLNTDFCISKHKQYRAFLENPHDPRRTNLE